jgi:hypothetical protein
MLRCGILIAVLVIVSSTCLAQGMRISTHVYDIAKADSRSASQIVSSSLTLMHNGRVYDYVDAADEAVIFDSVEKRFTIINESRELTTRITFDEIRHLMSSREPRTGQYIAELLASEKPADRKLAESLKFQLAPKFSQTFDPMKGTLVLSSASFVYRVETRKWSDAPQVERYLTYADWTSQLNSILHPSSLFPEPRLALNKAIRELKDRLPVSVELDLRPAEQFRLRAEHQLTHKVSDDDHRRIARWEERLNSKSLKEVSFRAYQQAALISKAQ